MSTDAHGISHEIDLADLDMHRAIQLVSIGIGESTEYMLTADGVYYVRHKDRTPHNWLLISPEKVPAFVAERLEWVFRRKMEADNTIHLKAEVRLVDGRWVAEIVNQHANRRSPTTITEVKGLPLPIKVLVMFPDFEWFAEAPNELTEALREQEGSQAILLAVSEAATQFVMTDPAMRD